MSKLLGLALGRHAPGRHLRLPPMLTLARRAQVAMATLGAVVAALWLPEPCTWLAGAGAMQDRAHGREAQRDLRNGRGEIRIYPHISYTVK